MNVTNDKTKKKLKLKLDGIIPQEMPNDVLPMDAGCSLLKAMKVL